MYKRSKIQTHTQNPAPAGSSTRRLQALRLLIACILLGSLLGACEYRTIGQSGMQFPTATRGAGSTGQNLRAATAKPAATKPPAPKAPAVQAQEANPVFCRLADLTPAATWNAAGGGLVGTLTLTNYWEASCTLRGQPELGIMDERGVSYPLEVSAPPSQPLQPPTWLFKQNTVGEVRFTWANWCGPDPQGSLRVTVALPGQSGPALYVVVQDPNGQPLSTPPPCTDPAKKLPSTLKVELLRLLN